MRYPFQYAAEKFSTARRALMLPHAGDEAESISGAMWECVHGLRELDRSRLDDRAAELVRTLEKAMDDTGIEDREQVGTSKIIAQRMSFEEKAEFSRVVDDLASWFAARSFDQS